LKGNFEQHNCSVVNSVSTDIQLTLNMLQKKQWI